MPIPLTLAVIPVLLASSSPSLMETLKTVTATPPSVEETVTKPPEPKPKQLICKGCNSNELSTLSFFYSQGITDKNALATIMGNIKQESMFIPNICEGGQRTSYKGCRSGGYGLIQWTSIGRYNGLGFHASTTGLSPSSLDGQLSFLVTEPRWKEIEPRMKIPGKSINQYMSYTYRWIGWGIHGARTHYAYDYRNRFVYV